MTGYYNLRIYSCKIKQTHLKVSKREERKFEEKKKDRRSRRGSKTLQASRCDMVQFEFGSNSRSRKRADVFVVVVVVVVILLVAAAAASYSDVGQRAPNAYLAAITGFNPE